MTTHVNGASMTAAGPSRVLVTGGSGFIGRRVVRALLNDGADVTVADQRPGPGGDVRTVTGDLCDPAVVAEAVRPGTDVIIHLAAVTRVLQSIEDPAATYRVNVEATAALLEQARIRGVSVFLFASTNAVTGDVGRATIDEQIPLRPLTPYGATKAAAEMLIGAYAACYGMTGCSLRFSNVYGPGMQEKDSFVPRLMRAARDGIGVQVYGDGTQVRDLVHVDDVVAGTYCTGISAPVTLRAASTMSFTDTDSPPPRISGPLNPARHAANSPATTSSTWTRSLIWVPSPYTCTPVPSRAARISRGTKLSFSCMPGP